MAARQAVFRTIPSGAGCPPPTCEKQHRRQPSYLDRRSRPPRLRCPRLCVFSSRSSLGVGSSLFPELVFSSARAPVGLRHTHKRHTAPWHTPWPSTPRRAHGIVALPGKCGDSQGNRVTQSEGKWVRRDTQLERHGYSWGQLEVPTLGNPTFPYTRALPIG
jgi:hypothetical protein